MAEGVVDLLEAVEIDQHHGRTASLAAGDRELLLDVAVEERAIRKARECVVKRAVLEFVHLEPELPCHPAQDRQQGHVEREQHELEDDDDWQHGLAGSARDGRVVAGDHEGAGVATVLDPDGRDGTEDVTRRRAWSRPS